MPRGGFSAWLKNSNRLEHWRLPIGNFIMPNAVSSSAFSVQRSMFDVSLPLHQLFQIEASRIHLNAPFGRAWPLFPRTIPIEFHAVVIRIAQIKRFAHAVVRCAF